MPLDRAFRSTRGHTAWRTALALVCSCGSTLAVAQAMGPSVLGQTGLVHMPDARIEPDGTLRLGVSDSDPYFAAWASVSFFSRLELSGRYTTIEGVPGFADAPALGDYRDKAFDAKLILWPESGWRPAAAVGTQDYVGTRLFEAQYLTLGSRWGPLDVTLGYGRERLDGVFGGIRYTPFADSGWHFIAEYDATDYRRDLGAERSAARTRDGGATYAIGYRAPWWGAQLGYQRGEWIGNLYLVVPLMAPEFVPKLHEPPPYDATPSRASGAQWRADPRHAQALLRALHGQGFEDVRVRWSAGTLELSLSHARISLMSRVVGRAARTALRLGPSDMSELRVSYSEREQPLVTYAFPDLSVLERYLAAEASRAELAARSRVAYATTELALALRHAQPFALRVDDLEQVPLSPDRFAAAPARSAGDWSLYPFNARLFFNDPGEPLRYDTFAAAAYRVRLGAGVYATASARLTLFEDVSDIRQPSTSLLPHVRSDIGEYRREGDRLRLNTLLLNKYHTPRERVYARWSLGYYEEMFAGGGVQLLYLPHAGHWAADVAVDALRQRAPGEAFGFRDYSVVTAIGSLHRRWPGTGVTLTTRAGRFLAKDEGVRFELKRRFRSGIELGFWYSWTNEKDITNPGTPDNPYRDKGLYASIPLNWLLTYDTRERATLALADYVRDVGQMVVSPDDLYRVVERPLALDSAAHDALTDFAR